MRKTALAILVVVAWIAPSASAHAFTKTTTFDVSVEALDACTVTATGIVFPDYDGVAAKLGTGDVTVTCSNGLPYHIALDAGLHFDGGASFYRRMASGVNMLDYELKYEELSNWGDSDYANTYPNGSSRSDTGSGIGQPHTVYGRVFAGQLVPPGTYSDTITVTVHY